MNGRLRAVRSLFQVCRCCASLAVCLLAFPSHSHALDIFWFGGRDGSGNGGFSSTANWNGGLVPSNTDVAHFDIDSLPPPLTSYTVTFSSNVTNQALVIHENSVVFDLNTRTYATTTSAGVAVGVDAGRSGKLTITDGTINVSTAGFPAPAINVGAAANAGGTLVVAAGGRITGSPNLNVGHLGGGALTVQSGGVVSIGANTSTIIGNNAGVDGTATITGPGSALTTNGLTVGNSGNGTLNLSILGLLQVNANSVMGNNAGSTATANVTNNAQWLTTGNLTVGQSGQGTLNISAVGLVRNVNGSVGISGFGSSGTVSVDGANSLWDNTGTLSVGVGGIGQVTITNQGQVRNTTGTLGSSIGGGGTLSVSDAGSQWINSGQAIVGGLGAGILNINAGGLVQNTAGIIGNGVFGNFRGNGTVNVDGVGSQWVNSLGLNVGNAGTGTLNITDGGHVTSGDGAAGNDNIGAQVSGSGHVLVDGPGSVWDNRGGLSVGTQGTAELEITNGAKVNGGHAAVGTFANGEGNVTVDGEGSQWNLDSILTIGDSGDGFLDITAGGVVGNTIARIGLADSGAGTVTVEGPGSQWINSLELIVGSRGTGTLSIGNGGTVENTVGVIANDTSGSTGTVTVADTDSLWDNSGELTVGNDGDGELTIEAGGRVENTNGTIGKGISATGRVTVTGDGSLWDNSGELTVGFEGEGTMHILDGGHVNTLGARVGDTAGPSSFVEVRGENSQWIVDTAPLIVGNLGGGVLEIRDGGRVQSDFATIGGSRFGRVTVEGPGATWDTESLFISGTGTGILTIDAGGVVNINTELLVGNQSGPSFLNLNGGEINLGSLLFSEATALITFNAGTFRFTGNYLIDDRLLDFVLGNAHTIGPHQHFAVAGKPTMETPLFLEGGTFSAGSLVHGSPLFFNSGTFNLTSDNFMIGAAGLFGDSLALSNRNINVTNTATIQSGARLQLQGGAFSAGTLINQGTIDFQDQSSQLSGGLLTNTGTIRGSGAILSSIQNNAVGQIQTTAGQRLEFGGAVTNGGTINLVGGQMQFNAAVTNSASTGLISAHDGIVRFVGGLANNGSLAVAFGVADVLGDVANGAAGRIIVSGGGQATFYDDITNSGSINVSASGPTQSTAIFLGSLSGNGVTGGGQVFIEGDARPGFSPGTMNFGGDLFYGGGATLSIELGGLARGTQYDAVDVADDAVLGGNVDVTLIDGFTPALGDTFEILTAAGGRSGTFALGTLPSLSGGLQWALDYTSTSALLSVVTPDFLEADFDEDGDVDGDDLAQWKGDFGANALSDADGDNDSDGADFLTWQRQVGSGLPATAVTGAVPEPKTLLLLAAGGILLVVSAWRRGASRAAEAFLTLG